MNCPKCIQPLTIADRSGVEIDFCPQCRGVWLDRGELDKIIDRVSAHLQATPPEPRPREQVEREAYYDERRPERRHGDDDDDYDPRYPRRKKKGFFRELFDFD